MGEVLKPTRESRWRTPLPLPAQGNLPQLETPEALALWLEAQLIKKTN